MKFFLLLFPLIGLFVMIDSQSLLGKNDDPHIAKDKSAIEKAGADEAEYEEAVVNNRASSNEPAKTGRCCSDKKCLNYRGFLNTTKTGRRCQAWGTDTYHPHSQRVKDIYNNQEQREKYGLDENYCRNPTGYWKGTWCYTTDPKKRWEICRPCDKCSDGSHDCHDKATCSNIGRDGRFKCECKRGHIGNGTSCQAKVSTDCQNPPHHGMTCGEATSLYYGTKKGYCLRQCSWGSSKTCQPYYISKNTAGIIRRHYQPGTSNEICMNNDPPKAKCDC